jgi:2'-5' RNA ligase
VTVRLFFAVWPPAKTAAALHAWALAARRSAGGRATRAETIHLTLAFLGDVSEDRLPELEALRIEGRRHDLPLEVARYWPRNRIVWAGPEQTPDALQQVFASLREELKARNFRTEAQQFAAHVTLIRNARAAASLPPPRVRWPVEEVVLVESRPAATGRDYQVVRRYALA